MACLPCSLAHPAPLLVAALLGVCACSQGDAPGTVWPLGSATEITRLQNRDDLSIVLVLVDTLRADHLGAYGYERDTSPVMDRMMAMGIRFARVRSQSSWTKTSMASLWTGAYPATIGIHRYSDALGESALLPAEILREAGFVTCGIFRNGWVAPNFGFSQGFDLYYKPAPSRDPERFAQHNPSAHPLQGTDYDATQAAIQFLRTYRDKRFLLYVHYMDVHQYLYEAESTRFGTRLVDAYDNAIHWTDRNVGALFAELERLDLIRRTVFAVASDHGESFLEHGQEGHGRNLYAEVTWVPFFLTLPFRLPEPIVVEPLVRNVDIWPTLFDLLGLSAPDGADGVSLLPLVDVAAAGADPAAPATSVASLDRTWGRARAAPSLVVSLTDWPYRIIAASGEEGAVELYELAADPGEQENLAESRPQIVAELRAKVEAYLARRSAGELAVKVDLDELQLQQLRALGYAVRR
jgi:arylsulfatase A-like enzyme